MTDPQSDDVQEDQHIVDATTTLATTPKADAPEDQHEADEPSSVGTVTDHHVDAHPPADQHKGATVIGHPVHGHPSADQHPAGTVIGHPVHSQPGAQETRDEKRQEPSDSLSSSKHQAQTPTKEGKCDIPRSICFKIHE